MGVVILFHALFSLNKVIYVLFSSALNTGNKALLLVCAHENGWL
jgi:hypothetical protein